MKKFAKKLSLESTYFANLQDLVADAIQFTYDVASNGMVVEDTEIREAGNNAIRLAEWFCGAQDRKFQDEAIKLSNEFARQQLGSLPRSTDPSKDGEPPTWLKSEPEVQR